MQKLSLLIVLLAVCSKVSLAQNGYNYDRPVSGINGAGGRPTQSGYNPAAATTPSYSSPSFQPTQGQGYPQGPAQGGYSPQGDDFSTGPSTGYPSAAGYPSSAPSRPTTGSGYPSTGTTANAPYPAAGQPQSQRPQSSFQGTNAPSGQGYPSGPAAPAQGYPSGPAAIPTAQRPGQGGAIGGGSQPGFGGGAIGGGQQGYGGQGGQGSQGGQGGQGSQGGQGGQGGSGSSSSSQQDDSQEGDYSAIPGEPDIDYPIFSEIPETSFDCNQQEFPGYYADVEARCQVFHICALNKTFNFLCPNGTIFSQESLVCVWWNQFDCNSAPGLYGNNANLYDNTQNGQQSAQGPSAQGPAANDFSGPTGGSGVSSAPYPAAGQPQSQRPQSSFQGTNAPSGQGYPSGPSSPNVPSSSYPAPAPQGFSPQADNGYPSGTPQTPTREYLPPRQG